MVVTAVQKLQEWMNKAAVAARELADQLKRDSIATAAANAASAYEKLNKQIAEANRLEKERNAILDQRRATARALEDAGLEREKQSEIAKLDPASATYAEDKAAIERRYARRASTMSVSRAAEDASAGAKRLYAEADRKDREASKLEGNYNSQMRAADRWRDTVFELGMRARQGEEGAKEKHDAAEAQYYKTYDGAQKVKEAMEALRAEAESIRTRAAEMTGGGSAAKIRDEALQIRLDNDEREAAARKDALARAEAERSQREAEKEAARNDAEKRREAGVAATALERQIASYESGVKSVAPSSNRLTAMGLGAGTGVAKVYDQMNKSLSDLVKNSKEQLAELRAIKDAPQTAVFSD